MCINKSRKIKGCNKNRVWPFVLDQLQRRLLKNAITRNTYSEDIPEVQILWAKDELLLIFPFAEQIVRLLSWRCDGLELPILCQWFGDCDCASHPRDRSYMQWQSGAINNPVDYDDETAIALPLNLNWSGEQEGSSFRSLLLTHLQVQPTSSALLSSLSWSCSGMRWVFYNKKSQLNGSPDVPTYLRILWCWRRLCNTEIKIKETQSAIIAVNLIVKQESVSGVGIFKETNNFHPVWKLLFWNLLCCRLRNVARDFLSLWRDNPELIKAKGKVDKHIILMRCGGRNVFWLWTDKVDSHLITLCLPTCLAFLPNRLEDSIVPTCDFPRFVLRRLWIPIDSIRLDSPLPNQSADLNSMPTLCRYIRMGLLQIVLCVWSGNRVDC